MVPDWPQIDDLASYAECLGDQTTSDETVAQMEARFGSWHETNSLSCALQVGDPVGVGYSTLRPLTWATSSDGTQTANGQFPIRWLLPELPWFVDQQGVARYRGTPT